MPSWLEDFFIVIERSKKTQFAFIFGAVACLTVLLIGHYQLVNFELQGSLSSIENTIKNALYDRYKKIALGVLVFSWFYGIKAYLKDRKKLLG